MPPLRRSTRAVKRVSYAVDLESSKSGSESDNIPKRKSPATRKKKDSDQESDYDMSVDASSSESSKASSEDDGGKALSGHLVEESDDGSDIGHLRKKKPSKSTPTNEHLPVLKLALFPEELLDRSEADVSCAIRVFCGDCPGALASLQKLAQTRIKHVANLDEVSLRRLDIELSILLLDYLSRMGCREVAALTQTSSREIDPDSLRAYYRMLVTIANSLLLVESGVSDSEHIDPELAAYEPSWVHHAPLSKP